MLWKPDEKFKIENAFDSLNISNNEKAILIDYLIVHKYYLEKSRGISMEDSEALFSWQEYVEEPARLSFIKHRFEEKTGICWPKALTLILNLWDFLKKQDPERNKEVSIDDAVIEFIKNHRKSNVY
jgi:hypothetical protein